MRYYSLVDPDNPNDAAIGIDQNGQRFGSLYANAETAEAHRQHLPNPLSCTVDCMTPAETADWAARICRDNPDIKTFIVFDGDLSHSTSLGMLRVEAMQDRRDPLS